MVRVKFIKKYKAYTEGEIAYVSNNEAHGLFELGVAVISKDMVNTEYKTKKAVKRADNGRIA